MTDFTDTGFQHFDNIGDEKHDTIESLTPRELDIIRGTGIQLEQLTAADIAAIKSALMFDNKLIEDAMAGNTVALNRTIGALRDMLVKTKDEEEIDEVGFAGLSEEEKKKRRERAKKIFTASLLGHGEGGKGDQSLAGLAAAVGLSSGMVIATEDADGVDPLALEAPMAERKVVHKGPDLAGLMTYYKQKDEE